MAPFAERLATAAAIAAPPRILATDIEARLGQRYTVRTLAALRRRFPRARFVLIVGADNLVQLPRWREWTRILSRHAVAVLPRPGWTRQALAGQAAHRFRALRRAPATLAAVGQGWCLVPAREHAASATAIRAARGTADAGQPRPGAP